MNISNFEREKPTKTYKSIKKALTYFEAKLQSLNPIMDDEDGGRYAEAEVAVELLKEIEKNFLAGK